MGCASPSSQNIKSVEKRAPQPSEPEKDAKDDELHLDGDTENGLVKSRSSKSVEEPLRKKNSIESSASVKSVTTTATIVGQSVESQEELVQVCFDELRCGSTIASQKRAVRNLQWQVMSERAMLTKQVRCSTIQALCQEVRNGQNPESIQHECMIAIEALLLHESCPMECKVPIVQAILDKSKESASRELQNRAIASLTELVMIERDCGLRTQIVASFTAGLVNTAPKDNARHCLSIALQKLVATGNLHSMDTKHIWENLINSHLALADVAQLTNRIFKQHLDETLSRAELMSCMERFQASYVVQASGKDVVGAAQSLQNVDVAKLAVELQKAELRSDYFEDGSDDEWTFGKDQDVH